MKDNFINNKFKPFAKFVNISLYCIIIYIFIAAFLDLKIALESTFFFFYIYLFELKRNLSIFKKALYKIKDERPRTKFLGQYR
jgi:hypothetical protein